FFSSRRRHTRFSRDWSSDVCSSDLTALRLGPVDILFVCGGVDVQEAVSPRIVAALRRLAERRVPLGALCTGGYALAKAGLLDKRSEERRVGKDSRYDRES